MNYYLSSFMQCTLKSQTCCCQCEQFSRLQRRITWLKLAINIQQGFWEQNKSSRDLSLFTTFKPFLPSSMHKLQVMSFFSNKKHVKLSVNTLLSVKRGRPLLAICISWKKKKYCSSLNAAMATYWVYLWYHTGGSSTWAGTPRNSWKVS